MAQTIYAFSLPSLSTPKIFLTDLAGAVVGEAAGYTLGEIDEGLYSATTIADGVSVDGARAKIKDGSEVVSNGRIAKEGDDWWFGGSALRADIAKSARDSILDRVLSGNHDTMGTVGKILQAIFGLTASSGGTENLNSSAEAGIVSALNPDMGALPFTVSVVDDSDGTDIEGATVRMTRTGKSGVQDTDANGNAPFSVDAFTWTITVDAAGYATKSTTYTVTGSGESIEVRLNSTTLPSSNTSGVCTCSIFVVDQNGNDVDGAEVSTSLKNAKQAKFSGNSLVHVTGEDATTSGGTAAIDLIQEMTYEVMVKHGKTQIKFEFTVPAATSAVMKKVTV